jgi:hypothetical protein
MSVARRALERFADLAQADPRTAPLAGGVLPMLGMLAPMAGVDLEEGLTDDDAEAAARTADALVELWERASDGALVDSQRTPA